MAKKIKLELTEVQFAALINIIDTLSAGMGCGDDDAIIIKEIKIIDRMLKANGYKRRFN